MSVHVCTFRDESQNKCPPSSDCLQKLLECMEPTLYGPVTTEQCLRRHGHTKLCIKDVSDDMLNIYTRNIQADFLQKTLSKKWNLPLVKDLIKKLPVDATETFRFLRNIPDKNRGTAKRPDYSSDAELFVACRNSEDSALILESFDIALQTKEPEYVVTALSSLISKNEATRKTIVDKTIAALMATSIVSPEETAKNINLSHRLCKYFDNFVPEKYQKAWAAFKIILEEYLRISEQLNGEVIFEAFSTSKKSVIEPEKELYEFIEKFIASEEPKSLWDTIPQPLKLEHAPSFVCVLHRLIANPTQNQEAKTYEEILTSFTNTCATLPSEIRTAIKAMKLSTQFLNKIAAQL